MIYDTRGKIKCHFFFWLIAILIPAHILTHEIGHKLNLLCMVCLTFNYIKLVQNTMISSNIHFHSIVREIPPSRIVNFGG